MPRSSLRSMTHFLMIEVALDAVNIIPFLFSLNEQDSITIDLFLQLIARKPFPFLVNAIIGYY
jgi:hypothetical protein